MQSSTTSFSLPVVTNQFAWTENAAAKQSTTSAPRGVEPLRGPQLGTDRGFKSCDDFAGVIGDLRVSQGGFAALESYSDHQRIFSCRNIFAAKQVGGFDRSNFRNVQRANRPDDIGESRAFRQ